MKSWKDLPPFRFIHDKYLKVRGRPAMLYITCSNCSGFVICYQKDGPGPLKRCYLDRIHYPPDVAKLSILKCPNCQIVVGEKYLYEKENRPAFLMKQKGVNLTKIPSRKRI